MCRQFAARFKRVPGLIYYLNGDFQLRLKDLPDLQRQWNQFLRERYATDEALRQAWANAPCLGPGQIYAPPLIGLPCASTGSSMVSFPPSVPAKSGRSYTFNTPCTALTSWLCVGAT